MLLYGLSMTARYEPARRIAACNPDSSALAVPIEDALQTATDAVPQLVYQTLQGVTHLVHA